jgi:hypothetical protein
MAGSSNVVSVCSLKAVSEGNAHVAQLVEHILGKDEVSGSIPLMGSSKKFCITETK